MSETNEAMQRLAALEAETRDLHRQLSEARVEAQAQRAGRVEAEHQRDVLVGRVGREVTAALVAAVPAKVADVLTGAQRIDEAMQKALDDAVTRAEKAEHQWRETSRYVISLERREHEERTRAEKAERERDEAIKTCTWLDKRVDEERALKESAMHGRDEARAEVARLTALLNPRPDAGLAGLAEREAVAEVKVERRPPFAWSDEDRAKLVPGASVVWWGGKPERVNVRNRPQETREGWLLRVRNETGNVVAQLPACDPATIEPPATQAEPARPPHGVCGICDGACVADPNGRPACPRCDAEQTRPPAPDLRKGDRITGRDGTEWTVDGDPLWLRAVPGWAVPITDPEWRHVRAKHLDLSTRVRTWQPGEVVPHAPESVARVLVFGDGTKVTSKGQGVDRTLPLAESWTQTGI